MTKVYLYGGTAKYSGTGAFEWTCPEIGSTHRLILFLALDEARQEQATAAQELARFGFTEIQIGQGKPIAAEVLNEPQLQAFQKHYEGALADGSSIVWYP